MSNRPRPSVLSLFDPLSDACLDRCPVSSSAESAQTPNSKQRPATNEACSETLFFKRTYSRSKVANATAHDDDIPPVPSLPGTRVRLIDVDDLSEREEAEKTITQRGSLEMTGKEGRRIPLSEVKSDHFNRNVEPLRVAATKKSASSVQACQSSSCDDKTDHALSQDITQDEIVLDVGVSTASDGSVSSTDFVGSPTVKLSLTQANSERPPSTTVPTSALLETTQQSSVVETPSSQQAPRFEDHPSGRRLDGTRRLSTDSHNSFNFKPFEASTDLVNDELSFMMGMGENSFLDHSKLGHESSRIDARRWTSEVTPQRNRAGKEIDENIEVAKKVDNASVFSPPTMTSTPPVAHLATVHESTKEDCKDLSAEKSSSESSGSVGTDSGPSGGSIGTITPSSSPVPFLGVAAPTKKHGGILPSTRPMHTRSESSAPQKASTQPLVIKKKAVDNSESSLKRSASTTNTLLRRRSSLKPPVSTLPVDKDAKDAKVGPPARVGGARRVPLTADAPLLLPKSRQELLPNTRSSSKGPQRPPVGAQPPPPVEPRVTLGLGSRNPTARVQTAAKPRPLSLQLPSTFSVSTGVPPSVTKLRSTSVTSAPGGTSKLPQPQTRSRIPGPLVRSSSMLRKGT